VLPWTERAGIALVAALPVLAVVLTVVLVIVIGAWLCCWLLSNLSAASTTNEPAYSTIATVQRLLIRLPQALVLTLLLVLLVDNFTYTLAGVGIVSTQGISAYLYLVAVFVAFLWFARRLAAGKTDPIEPGQQRIPHWKLAVALLLPIAGIGFALQALVSYDGEYAPIIDSTGKRPNILFFATDGIEADYISGYGYKQKTTPNLDAVMGSARVFEAAIANAARTTGSTV